MKTKSIAIIIPARYGSERFPGKPLALIAGKSMLTRVHDIAIAQAALFDNAAVYITTDDERIQQHALKFTQNVIMTPSSCLTGSSRVLKASEKLPINPDIILNLQGDVPLLPGRFIHELIKVLLDNPSVDVATPVTKLSWPELEALKEWKVKHPFSGTTAIIDKQGKALWFSKSIIPAIRHEKKLRNNDQYSPIYRHIGLYAYRYNALKQFIEFDESDYEKLEGLEQLRLLENGISIQTIQVSYGSEPAMSGVDTQDDLKLAETLFLNQKGCANA